MGKRAQNGAKRGRRRAGALKASCVTKTYTYTRGINKVLRHGKYNRERKIEGQQKESEKNSNQIGVYIYTVYTVTTGSSYTCTYTGQ